MNRKMEVVLTYEDEEEVRGLMEDILIQIVADRISEFPKEDRVYIYDELLEKLKECI
ncbi:hypothetical protein [Tepidibacter mesophilus]|uniref:hypothetical protein n=1 Tax=Tepidibacter mesophilus TaxID=655607 RepID=UPI0016517CC7|nr:hypothetical protein [Tepidibacter mesophilus]